MTAQEQTLSVSPFLELPAELRNMIYSHVLETDRIIQMMPYNKDGRIHQRMFFDDPRSKLRVELSQMKFVCKQLYEETSNLPPTRCPKLTFPLRKDTAECASIICERYLASPGAENLDEVRHINVHERIPHGARKMWKSIFDPLGMSQLVTFAANHPNASIHVFLDSADPWKTYDPISYIACLCYLIARKRIDPTCPILCNANLSILKDLAKVWPGYAFDAPPFPNNIVFRPGCGVNLLGWNEWVGRRTYFSPNFTPRYKKWFFGLTQ